MSPAVSATPVREERIGGRFVTAYTGGDFRTLESLWAAKNESLENTLAVTRALAARRCVTAAPWKIVRRTQTAAGIELIVEILLDEISVASGRRLTPRIERWRIVVAGVDEEWTIAEASLWANHAAAELADLPAGSRLPYLRDHADWLDTTFIKALAATARKRELAADYAVARDLVRMAGLVTASGDDEARTLSAQARLSLVAGQRELAEEQARTAVELAKATKDADALAVTYANLTQIVQYVGKSQRGELAVDPPAVFAVQDEALDVLSVVQIHAALAISFGARGNLLAAMRHLAEMERLAPLAHDPWARARRLFTLALIYNAHEDFELAIRAADEAKQIAERFNAHQIVAHALLSRAQYSFELGDRDTALAGIAEAMRMSKAVGDRVGEDRAIAVAAIMRLRLREAMTAEELAVMRKQVEAQGEYRATFVSELARYFGSHGRFQEMAATAREMQERFADAADDHIEGAFLEAEALHSLGQTKEAISILQRASDRAEEWRSVMVGSERQRRLGGRPVDAIHAQLSVLLIEEGRTSEALMAAERGRARTMLDLLAGAEGWLPANLSREERLAIADVERRIRDLTASLTAGAPQDAATIRARLNDARMELEGLRAQFFFGRATADRHSLVPTLTPGDLESLPRGTAFLEYVQAFDAMYALVVTNGDGQPRVKATKLPMTSGGIARTVQELSRAIENRGLEYGPAARKAYQALIAPIYSELRGASMLCIIPTGPLWNVSFAALRDERGRYLLDRFALSYQPSIAAFLSLSSRKRNGDAPRLLAIANPTLSAETRRGIRELYSGVSLGDLPERSPKPDS